MTDEAIWKELERFCQEPKLLAHLKAAQDGMDTMGVYQSREAIRRLVQLAFVFLREARMPSPATCESARVFYQDDMAYYGRKMARVADECLRTAEWLSAEEQGS